MTYSGRRPVSAEIEDTVYACRRCGAELIRTSMRKSTKPDTGQSSEAA
ncbi:MAG TPA: hypothetical protein VE396_08485 [Xanthobacteraceae bacterium]|jgi:hypothetical protein|nr:hypothetical protein [Xanthobacteraceae bacterium]